MLRITTASAPSFSDADEKEKDEHRESSELESTMAQAPTLALVSHPLASPDAPAATAGGLRSLARPGFLRFGRSGGPLGDVERGVAPVA